MERDATEKTLRLCRLSDEGAAAYRGWPYLFQRPIQDLVDGKVYGQSSTGQIVEAFMYEQSFDSFVTKGYPALWPLAFGKDDIDVYATVNALLCKPKKELNKNSPFQVVDDILNVFLGANTSNNSTFYIPTEDAVSWCKDPATHKYVHPSGYTDTHKNQLSVSGKFGIIPPRDCDKSSLEWKLSKGRPNVLVGVDITRAKAFRAECGKTQLFKYLQDRFEDNAKKKEGKEANQQFITNYPQETPLDFAVYKRPTEIDQFAIPWKIVVVGTAVMNEKTRSVARFSLDEDGLAFKEDVPTLVVKPRIRHLDERYFLAVFNSPIFEYWARFRQYKGRRMWRLKQRKLLECTIALPSADSVKQIHYIHWLVDELITATGSISGLTAESTSSERSDVWDGMEESRYVELSAADKAAYNRRRKLQFAANDFVFSVFGVQLGDRAVLAAVLAASDTKRVFEPPSLQRLQLSPPAVGSGVVPTWAVEELGYNPHASVRPRPQSEAAALKRMSFVGAPVAKRACGTDGVSGAGEGASDSRTVLSSEEGQIMSKNSDNELHTYCFHNVQVS